MAQAAACLARPSGTCRGRIVRGVLQQLEPAIQTESQMRQMRLSGFRLMDLPVVVDILPLAVGRRVSVAAVGLVRKERQHRLAAAAQARGVPRRRAMLLRAASVAVAGVRVTAAPLPARVAMAW